MKNKPKFIWNKDTGLCSCSIIINDFLAGYGIAECAPQDMDMLSERTG